ncbi:MAG: prepilin-type N-terminal cleavage/methylation domain-containing protein [Candidatus Omnitrophica bacterium]|nr:prepilin-type N-terminal cleavage/methylation domain-containing protein [Candidatus Omnitrophota bacterium]
MKKNGFTLMELMLTVIVIAILVSIAIPNYINTVERARAREARATLESMRAAEQTYASERRVMISLDETDSSAWTMVGLEDPHNNNRRSWDYTFDAVSGNGTAVRNSGPYVVNWTIQLGLDGTETVTNGP